MSESRRSWTVAVDRGRCLGTGVCCFYAPSTFDLDGDGRSMVVDPDGDPDDAVRNAVEACPTRALTIVGAVGSPSASGGDDEGGSPG
jgi:ferredoxin